MSDLRRSLGSRLICGFNGVVLPDSFRTLLSDGCLGGIILFARNYAGLSGLKNLTSLIKSLSPRPVLIAVDQEGGRVARFTRDFPVFPSPAYYSRRKDPDGLVLATSQTARLLATAGINLNLIPVCDLAPDDWSHIVYSRAYSSDPDEVAEVVQRQIEALRLQQILACGKHFPGLASAYGDPHLTVSRSDHSLSEFRGRDYAPFRAAIAVNVDMIMTTHLIVPSVDADHIATFSPIFTAGELRQHLGFEGIIISDDLLMAGALQGISATEAGIRAIKAGCDLLIYGELSDNITQVIDSILGAAEADMLLMRQLVAGSERIDRFRVERIPS
jgi:beta-N-acetylhexosaminidase